MALKANFTIIDPIGIHARPAMKIVQVASRFSSNLSINFNGKTANLKSIMNLMALGILTNSHVEIVADGRDEKDALEEIKKVMILEKVINNVE
ncbi:HPr family phosphocarrier protein [Mycoplasma sp. SG1]|uniref:HPr family phosphocarrier protein n=1 Tax=Mycoplasma sp. SG1 TaxID=2810348 RepID=UPI0020257990|nr:HPr family phosphocarrier protein [Mycoplasma sp. SG1]URM53009.1 HPr family phosphocarrier protein [Mycoplasma sp. SG1]